MISKKEKYQKFCEEQQVPIFLNNWWLDATCGSKNWNCALFEKGGEVFGVLPYYTRKSKGFIFIENPALTQHLGVWLRYPEEQGYDSRLSFEKEAYQDLSQQIPNFDFAFFSLHHSIKNWLPFKWRGFECSVNYTYTIDDISNIDKVYENFSSRTKKNIKKAEKTISIVESQDIAIVFKMNTMTFDRQQSEVPFSIEQLQRLDSICKSNNCRKILVAKDSNGQIHSALYLVWTKETAYYLIGGSDPNHRNSEAMSLLMFHAIREASNVSKSFDFEGSNIESIEKFVRGFGSTQKPYFVLKKWNNKLLKVAFQILGK